MNDNTDSRSLTTELVFTLDVRVLDQTPRKLEVIDRVLAGIDPRNDLILIDPKIKTKHFLFRKRNNILTVHYLGRDGDTFLNGLPLEKGKLYILEKGDILKVGKVEIIIRRETRLSKSLPPRTQEDLPLTESITADEFPEAKTSEKEEVEEALPAFTPMPVPKARTIPPQKKSVSNLRAMRLIPYKVYGFLVDVALTYLILGFVIPSLGLLSLVQDFLYPITSFLTENIIAHHPELTQMKILSVIEFFICFHFFMIFMSLILGTTPGAFLIGLHHKDDDKSILALRFKAYLYALINIVFLPFLVFDIPIHKGKNFKELITFSQREITNSTLFTISRRAITPILTLACFLSPFFLKPPFTSPITEERMVTPKYKDVHTNTLSSSSGFLGVSLHSELNNQFVLLPYLEKNKLGMALYDLNTKKALIMREENRISISSALFKLRYANPLSSLTIPNDQIENEVLKNKTLQSLHLSLDSILKGVNEFGPFLANGFLFKNEMLKNFGPQDNFQILTFDKKNPAIKISAGTGNIKEEKIFLFTRKEIIEFSLTIPKQTKLLDNFMSGVFTALKYDQSTGDKLKSPQVLEVLESFERGSYQTILTYYINEAKKAEERKNPEWRSFLKKNILQTKLALNGSANKNIEKSFDDIINSL